VSRATDHRTLAAPADVSKGGDGRYVLPVKFGLGGVPLGNEFEVVSDQDAYKTLEAAWNAGVRYYDVSPWYGLGLAERRYGNFLHNKNRDDYVLSIEDEAVPAAKRWLADGGEANSQPQVGAAT